MCLAPCFKGCTDEEYAAEVGRVQQYLQSGGQSLVREIERMRDEASANLDFEGAAALHTRLEKVKAATSQLPEIVRRLDELNGVMIQPSAEPESVALFKIEAGMICDPVSLNVGAQAEAEHLRAKPLSMEARILEALTPASRAASRTARWNGWSTWRSSSAGITVRRRQANCSWPTAPANCRCGAWCAACHACFAEKKPPAT